MQSLDENRQWLTDFGDPEPDHCRFICFVNPETGWIAALDTLGATTDGGKTVNGLKGDTTVLRHG